jgi:hypothetical protein
VIAKAGALFLNFLPRDFMHSRITSLPKGPCLVYSGPVRWPWVQATTRNPSLNIPVNAFRIRSNHMAPNVHLGLAKKCGLADYFELAGVVLAVTSIYPF